MWFFLRLDVIRPASRRWIALTFLWGCVATIPAALLEFPFISPELLESDATVVPDFTSVAVAMLLVVGPVEELCKFGAVRFGAYRSLYFDSPIHGLVFSIAASLGFASLENLFYVLQYGPEVMLLRAPLSTLGHLVFGAIWGQALGRYYASGGQTKLELAGSLAGAALIHGLFNVFVFTVGPVALLLDAVLVLIGSLWVYGTFRSWQHTSPFRLRRNYPKVNCQRCGNQLMIASRFCNSCGAPVRLGRQPLLCSNCSRLNEPDARFCIGCGDQLLHV